MNGRINGHRSDYKKYCEQHGILDPNSDVDRYAIGIHLYREHGLTNHDTFNQHMKFTILENCSPKDLSVKEHLWIQKTKSLYPECINLNSPYGLPLFM